MNVIVNIENLMKKKGISVYRLEKDTGIKQSSFSHWKKGTQPTVDKIIKICEYLKVTPDQIFGYNDSEDDPDQEDLTENEIELLKYFRQLPDREQVKMIGRMEDKAKEYKNDI